MYSSRRKSNRKSIQGETIIGSKFICNFQGQAICVSGRLARTFSTDASWLQICEQLLVTLIISLSLGVSSLNDVSCHSIPLEIQ